MTNKNLKPCPFCGGVAESVVNMMGTTAEFVVRCFGCGAFRNKKLSLQSAPMSDFVRYIDEAYDKVVEKWNGRAVDEKAENKTGEEPKRVPWEAN